MKKWIWLAFVLVTLCITVACSDRVKVTREPSRDEKIVSHALGESIVPKSPEKIAALDPLSAETASALGVQLLAAPTEILQRMRIPTTGIMDSGTETNLEVLLSLKPDLILGAESLHRKIYSRLVQVAPTVLLPGKDFRAWPEAVEYIGAIVNRSEQAKALLTSYTKRVENLRKKIGNKLSTIQVSVVRIRPDRIRLYLKDSFAGVVLEEIGLARPQAQNKSKRFQHIGKERFQDADGNLMFVIVDDNLQVQKAYQELKSDHVWSTLEAVQNQQVYEVGGYWVCCSILAANRILDDLAAPLSTFTIKK